MTTAIPVILKDTAGNYVLPQSYQVKATAETLGSVRVGSGLSMSNDGVLSTTADSTKANTSLNNLSSDGQMIVDSANGTISNCVLEIPQNIKLELANNVLTLKSGSVLILQGSTYATITTTENKTRDFSSQSDGVYVAFSAASNGAIQSLYNINKIGSGDTLPVDNEASTIFYNTTDNLIYRWATDHWNNWGVAYPLCVVEVSKGVASFAKDSNGNDMIFNGACFIGHHAVVYPNVTVFYPNGYSDTKHLNSIKITTNQLYITELATNRNCLAISAYTQQVTLLTRGADLNDKNLITTNNKYHYITTENYIYSKTSSGYVQRPLMFFVDYTYNGTTVTDFTIRQPVSLATTEMLDNVQLQVDTKADQSLSNLDSNGQMVVDSQNGTISNCILDIPQNIKLTLENNVLTLKAGSILTKTGDTYSTYTTTSDITATYSNNGKYYVVATTEGVIYNWFKFDKFSSGATLPADNTNYDYFFLTTDKRLYLYGSNGWYIWRESYQCYPLGIIEIDNGVASFVKDSNGNDMIFNGCGFIGHHAFVYPNVKALMPNGFNKDGSLKSFFVTTSSLTILEIINASTTRVLALFGDNSARTIGAGYEEVYELPQNFVNNKQYYEKKSNKSYQYYSGAWHINGAVLLANISSVSSNGVVSITDFVIRQPVRLATTEMLNNVQSQIDTNTTAIASKQDTLVSGTNIKTINNESIVGSGNISIVSPDIATTYVAGLVKPDGTSIVIDNNGVISAAGSSSNIQEITDEEIEELWYMDDESESW